ncbi:hypothetical protein FKW77_008970 [Venturia effusa]|uniref:Uncharacterized protein n=1 Tax=Venturia effusa TaxID=50376 RepID=A0A517LEG9_9PEZI|nr:hypothetical protein FKW77_008970 [Venturia effusa]
MSPPTLLTIPRELRQHILKYAFDDAGERDLRLNEFLRGSIAGRTHYWSNHPILNEFARGSWNNKEIEYTGPAFFPNLYGLAVDLRSAIPELFDDMMFVLAGAFCFYVKASAEMEEKRKDDFWRQLWTISPIDGNTQLVVEFFPRARRMRPSNFS